MSENRKLLLDKFHEHLDSDYQDFCKKHQILPSTHSFTTFLIDHNLIPKTVIKRYTVKQEFQDLIQILDSKKTKTVNALSDKFNIPERTVWSIIKQKK